MKAIICTQGYSKRNRNKSVYRIVGDPKGREYLTQLAAQRAACK